MNLYSLIQTSSCNLWLQHYRATLLNPVIHALQWRAKAITNHQSALLQLQLSIQGVEKCILQIYSNMKCAHEHSNIDCYSGLYVTDCEQLIMPRQDSENWLLL